MSDEEVPRFEMIDAKSLVENPESAAEMSGRYRTIYDSRRLSLGSFGNLEKAMNIMAKYGWKPIAAFNIGGLLCAYVIMEKV